MGIVKRRQNKNKTINTRPFRNVKYQLRSKRNKEFYSMNERKNRDYLAKMKEIEKIKNICGIPSNKPWSFWDIQKKLKEEFPKYSRMEVVDKTVHVNSVSIETLREKKSKFIDINYNNYDERKCRNECNLCENGKKCPKKKLEKVRFFLYKHENKFYLIYFSNITINPYEIIEQIYDFQYRHGENIIRTDKIYDLKQKCLVETKYNQINKSIENGCHNKGLSRICHLEKNVISNERCRIFVDTEGGVNKMTQVGYFIYDMYHKKLIERIDSRDSSNENVIQKLNKWVAKKDCIIYTHNTDHDVEVLALNGFKYDVNTNFCCTSFSTNYTDLDSLCEQLKIIIKKEERHNGVYDAELLLGCFLKSDGLFKYIKRYNIPRLKTYKIKN